MNLIAYFFVGVEECSRYTSGLPILIVCSMDFWRHVVKDTENQEALNRILQLRTGELINIDFGIAFDRGGGLPLPEKVPFRLTRDIEAGGFWGRVTSSRRAGMMKHIGLHRTFSGCVCLHNFDGDFAINQMCLAFMCVSWMLLLLHPNKWWRKENLAVDLLRFASIFCETVRGSMKQHWKSTDDGLV